MSQTIESQIIGGYALSLTIMGTVGNLLTVGICYGTRLRKTSTFIFLANIAAIDIAPLYLLNLDGFFRPFYTTLESPLYCALFPALHNTCWQTTSWLLVILTTERCICVKIKRWRRERLDGKKAAITSTSIALFFLLLNCQQFFNTPFGSATVFGGVHNNNNNNSVIYKCKLNQMYFVWAQVQTYTYSIVPTTINLILNLILIKSIIFKKERSKRTSDEMKIKLSISVICVNVCFLLFTLPHSIAIGYFLERIIAGPNRLLMPALNVVAFTYHSCHFLTLMITNKEFSRQATNLFVKYKVSPLTIFHLRTSSSNNN